MKENNEKQLEVFEFPTFISLKNIGDSVSGEYVKMVKDVPTANGYATFIVLKNDLGEFVQFVATVEVKNFFNQYKPGHYVKITRKGTITLPSGRQKATYRFEYEPSGMIVVPPEDDDLPF